VIAGIHGMNFTHMPELDWRFGNVRALALMVAIGLVLAVLFRRKGRL
jgi:magnesium transporter